MKKKKIILIGILLVSLFSFWKVSAETSKALINIDYPTISQEVSDTLKIQGWIMTTEQDAELEVLVDKEILEDISRNPRVDVLKAISGYGDETTNKTPGFSTTLSLENYAYGMHTLEINVYDKNGKLLKNSTRKFIKSTPKTLVNIDYPTTNQVVTDSLKIQGWVMTTVKDSTIKVYIDKTEIEEIQRQARADVLKVIKGYGDGTTNPTPGFSKTIDLSSYSYGTHTVKIEVYDSKEKCITTTTRTFTKKQPNTIINIDYPTPNQKIIDSLKIQGWYITEAADTTIELYLDDTQLKEVTTYKRADVLKAYPSYKDTMENQMPGFTSTVDLTKVSYGLHTIKIQVKDKNNNILKEAMRTFTRSMPNTIVNIDYPTTNQKVENSLKIQGWYLSTGEKTTVKVYVDNVEIKNTSHYARGDVLKAISGYGNATTNPTPGFSTNVDISSYSYGIHTVGVKVYDQNNVLLKESYQKINKIKPEAIINIDYPTQALVYQELTVKGWYVVKDTNTHAEIYVDNSKLEAIEGSTRSDVVKAYPAYATYMKNQKPGYSSKYNTTSLKDGTHVVTVRIVSDNNKEVIATKTKTFTLQKYKGHIEIDYPKLANINSDFKIIGWEMSELDNSYVKIYLDNKEVENPISRYARDDVIEAITSYGDGSVNATPGFSTSVSISKLSDGAHTIKIELYTKLDEKIATETKKIYLYSNIYNGIDIYSGNKVTSWAAVKASGVDYAILRAGVRGYGINAQGIDGNLLADSAFKTYASGATKAGIKIGAYVYSQAITEIEAVQEANLLIQQVQAVGGKSTVTLPLVIDTEFSSCKQNGVRCGRADDLTREKRTKLVKTMAQTIQAAGYTPMIYASTSFLNNQLNMSELSEYSVWVAHYDVDKPTYQGTYQIWQYTSSGSINGISGKVDLDYFYTKY